MRNYDNWSEKEEEFIRNYAGEYTDDEMAKMLSRFCGRKISKAAYRKKRQRLGVAKKNGRGICKLRNERKSNEH